MDKQIDLKKNWSQPQNSNERVSQLARELLIASVSQGGVQSPEWMFRISKEFEHLRIDCERDPNYMERP